MMKNRRVIGGIAFVIIGVLLILVDFKPPGVMGIIAGIVMLIAGIREVKQEQNQEAAPEPKKESKQ